MGARGLPRAPNYPGHDDGRAGGGRMGGVPGGTAQAGKCHPLSWVPQRVESSSCIFLPCSDSSCFCPVTLGVPSISRPAKRLFLAVCVSAVRAGPAKAHFCSEGPLLLLCRTVSVPHGAAQHHRTYRNYTGTGRNYIGTGTTSSPSKSSPYLQLPKYLSCWV